MEPSRGPLRVLVRLSGTAYLVALIALAALVYWPSERLWAITLFLFGPRWVFALPFLLLLPLATLVDRRLAAALVVAGALLARAALRPEHPLAPPRRRPRHHVPEHPPRNVERRRG
jgi:hypothetical protein